ncbi:MAG: Ig-like domain-containing protein, partial [Muribaculaceae bacterium]|nr:Ig-like domain-containing protein [Muribaculaceae bacterium]
SGCSGLTSIELPQSLNSIGHYAFEGCSGLTSIIYNTDNPTSFSSQDIFNSETTDEAILYVPEDCFEAVKDLTPWNNFKNIKALPSLSISNEELSIWSGETSDLNVTVSPEEMPFGKVSVEWKSSDQIVAVIEGDGLNISINALKGGVATIDCILTWGDVWKQTLQCNVTVKETLKGLKIESDKDEILKGKSLIVSAIVDPSDAYYQDITWSSSDESIAQVLPSTNGHALVKALKGGKVTITAEAGSEEEGGFASATLDLLVIQPVESLSLDPEAKEAEEGDTFQITATVFPEDATDKTLEWSSSDESVATVDQSGLVSVLKEGECVITAKTTDGSDLSANCYLSATSGINDIFFDTDETVDVYSLDGVKVRTNCKKNEALNLPTGVYLLRKGNKVKKLIIR